MAPDIFLTDGRLQMAVYDAIRRVLVGLIWPGGLRGLLVGPVDTGWISVSRRLVNRRRVSTSTTVWALLPFAAHATIHDSCRLHRLVGKPTEVRNPI